ncbi:MAG: UDP-glucose 4-epimerase GalE [Deltaproteobacteria bacterium]|jgi:UDP-glucose 4-epimerase|nr:UDP-glucose 4-epimerase GalE [Deltaproteobacteria bacterium]MBT4525231.1 UDP-glucose 4-epimerase GalE [Deltaproteobacteria bacterium]
MSTILIIGGAGYIGSHVVLEFLNAGHEVTILDNMSSGQQANLQAKAKFIHGDIQDRIKLREVFQDHYDAVVHLAALKAAGESMFVPDQYSIQNINGTLNILDAMSKSSCKVFIFSSSAAVYGMPEYLPMDEKHPLQPINYYGFTKLEVERFLGWFDQLKNIKFASLRYFNAAGYDTKKRIKGLEQNPANLLPIILETVMGIRPEMSVFGNNYPTSDGTCIRDYIHVTDLAIAHLKSFETILKTKQSLKLNLGTGKGFSVLDMIKTTEKVTGQKVNYNMAGRREGDPADLVAKADLAKEIMGWEATQSDLENLVRSTWEVYKLNINKK